MSTYCPDKVQAIGEMVQSGEYQVDPVAVAEAMLRRIAWDGVPDLSAPECPRQRRAIRLRGLVRVRQLASAPMPPGAQGSA